MLQLPELLRLPELLCLPLRLPLLELIEPLLMLLMLQLLPRNYC